jgi:Tfp pilus assembly protein PilF/4-amino-4-deoxy-L-arabinose transferase-like glycosyltransferase
MNLENPTKAAAIPQDAEDQGGGAFGRDISAKVFKDYLVYLFLLGLIVRTGFLVEHARSPSFGVATLDQKYYDTAARMLLAGQDLHLLRGLRPLLYPMFLAGLYKLGGSHGVDLAVVAQHLLGVLTGVLAALLGARLFRHRLSGLAGGVLYMLAPVPLYFEGELLIESSYTFLICLGLLLVLRTAGTGGWKSGWLWLLCGGLTVLTAQARPNILVFMAVFPLLAGWRWWRSRQWAALWPLWALAGGAAMGLPWGFVNKMQSDHFQAIPSAGGVNLYLGNKRASDGMTVELNRRVNYSEEYEDSVEVWARQEYEAAMRAQGRRPEPNPMAISKYWTQRAIGEIEAAPAAWLRLMAKKSWLMLWNAEVPNNKAFAFLQTEFIWLRLLPVRWAVLLMFAPAGIWAAAKWGNREALFILLLYVFLYSAANIAFFICDRYRYPLWPVMASIGGGGLLALVETIRRRRWPGVVGIAAGMALMASLSLPNWFGAKLPTFARDYLFRSIAWYQKGHFAEALSDMDRSVALDPSDATALHQRGNVLLALDRLEEARQEYEQTLKISSEDAGVWNNYGIVLDRLGRTNEALDAFRRATECNPPSRNAFLGLAFAHIHAGRLAEAAGLLDKFDHLARSPNAVVLALRSVLAARLGQAAQAGVLERQARRLDPAAATWAIDRASNTGHGTTSAWTPAP